MANFRAERLFLRIAGSIDGFDPNEGINPQEFAFLMVRDDGAYERPPLSEFTFAPFDKPRWSKASKGLRVVRAFIAELEKKLERCEDDAQRATIERDLTTLRAVEDRLDAIDIRDLRFYFLARDLD